MKLEILRNTNTAELTVALVEIDEATVFVSELSGTDKISAEFYTENYIDVKICDYVVFRGRAFKVNTIPYCEMVDKRTYLNRIDFFGEIYDLYNEILIHEGRTRFTYSGDAEDLLNLLVNAMNIDVPTHSWQVGQFEENTKVETFTFSEVNCRVALTDISERFGLEYNVEDRKINLVKRIGIDHDLTLEYGRGKGLQNVVRQPIDRPFATVWYCYGGSQNLPDNYRNGMDRLTLSAPVERNVSIYGRKKGSVTFPDVYPQRTGVVSSVVTSLSFTDSSLDFNINSQVIINSDAKVVFKSGELSGQEFKIASYDNATKKITIASHTDEYSVVMPNSAFSIAVGDTYTLINIVMPLSYIQAAEAELLKLAKEYAKANSYPPVSFPLSIDEKFVREMDLKYKLRGGDTVVVKCTELGIWSKTRLQSVSYPLVNPYAISGVVADNVPYTSQELLIKDVRKLKRLIS